MSGPGRGRRALRTLLLLAASLVVAWVVIGRVGAIDWAGVERSVGKLALWQVLLLVALVLVRQPFGAAPLVSFVPSLGGPRAVINDQAATLMRIVAPPPADLVTRTRILVRWRVEPPQILAGVVMHKVVHYAVRWFAPVLGFVLVLTDRFDTSFGAAALAGGIATAVLLVAVALLARGSTTARAVGRTAGRVAGVVGRDVDLREWEGTAVDVREQLSGRLAAGLVRSVAGLVVVLACDALIALLAVRFVGVPAESLPAVEVFAAILLVHPLTMLPVFGIGVLDAFAVAIMVGYSGLEFEGALVAAMLVWRAVTIGASLVLGAAALLAVRMVGPLGGNPNADAGLFSV